MGSSPQTTRKTEPIKQIDILKPSSESKPLFTSALMLTRNILFCFSPSACVKVGSRVWAKTEKGIFYHGVVIAIDEEVHIKLDNGKKIKHSKTEPEAFVADILPHPLEIEVGARVLARWYGRQDSYYPGIVIGVKRSYFDIKFDDGDKGCNELSEIRIMRPPEIQGELRRVLKRKKVS